MPEIKSISGVYKQHQTGFVKSLKAAKTLNEEAIHKLRVETKKLRSLFSFLNFLSAAGFKKKKIAGLISPVYKAAGKYRTARLNIKLVDAKIPEAPSEFKNYLKARANRAGKRFLKELKNFDKQKFKESSEKPLALFKKENMETVTKKSRMYINNAFSEIKRLVSKMITDETLHEMRKKLKDVKTIIGLLKELNSGKEQLQQLEKVKGLEEKIGNWHDMVVLAEHLEKFVDRGGGVSSALVTKLKTGNNRRKKSIASQVSKFVS